MKLTRRGFLGTIAGALGTTICGVFGLSLAGPKPKPCPKYVGSDANLMWYAPEGRPFDRPEHLTLEDARREIQKYKEEWKDHYSKL